MSEKKTENFCHGVLTAPDESEHVKTTKSLFLAGQVRLLKYRGNIPKDINAASNTFISVYNTL